MAVRKIVIFPDPRLREKCAPIEEVTDETRTLLDDMVETMDHAYGIGLAAPQIGVLQRAIVLNVGNNNSDDDDTEDQLYKIVNPVITASDGKTQTEEGCLSIPGIRETVKRPRRVTVEGLDENGETITIEADGLLSICLQHEIDHLNGVLFIDHLSRLKRNMLKSQLKRLAFEEEEEQ